MGETIKWIDAGGTEYPLTGQPDIDVLFDREGFFMPPVSFVEQSTPVQGDCGTTPLQEGASIQRLTIEPREIRMKLIIKGNDPASVRQAIRKYISGFNPLRGPGKLQVITPDNSVRELVCWYEDGAQGQENRDNTGQTFQMLALVLKAFDPYWYSTTTTSITLTQQSTASTFFPFFPLTLSHYGVFGDFTITNDGEAVAYPIWTIYGPASNLRIDNLTTGEFIHLHDPINNSATLLNPGEYLTIDTTPGKFKVEKNNGVPMWQQADPGSSMFGFAVGDNKIRVEIDTPTSETKVDLTYQTRYLTI